MVTNGMTICFFLKECYLCSTVMCITLFSSAYNEPIINNDCLIYKVSIMEKTKIGLNAGKVWRILNERGELSMFDLCRELGLTFEDVALAIGWLAREDKILLRNKDGMLFVTIENVEFSFG